MYAASARAFPNVLPREAYSPRNTCGPSRSYASYRSEFCRNHDGSL